MKQFVVEWKHLDVGGTTCDRCSDTGEAVREVVRELMDELRAEGVELQFVETRLGPDRIPESNQILLNGVPLEGVLPGAAASENACCSCTEILGVETSCRTLELGGTTFEAIPADLIRQAIRRAAGIESAQRDA